MPGRTRVSMGYHGDGRLPSCAASHVPGTARVHLGSGNLEPHKSSLVSWPCVCNACASARI